MRPCTTLLVVLFLSAGCGAGERRAHERDIDAQRALLGVDDDPVEAILRGRPGDERLEAALAATPSLEDVREAAVRRNPSLRVALERWVAHLERVPQRLAPPAPTFEHRYSSMFKMNSFGASLGLPFPGKLLSEAKAALAFAGAARADFRSLENELRAQATAAYAQLQLARRQAQVLDESVALVARLVDVVQGRYRAGTATLADVLRLEAERETLRATRTGFAREADAAASSLNVLLDRHPDATIGAVASLAAPGPLEPLPALYARALTAHPDLEAAAARATAGEALVDRADQEWLPDLSVGASYVRDFGAGNNFVELSAGVTLPFFLWPGVGARVREAEAEARAARAEVRVARNRVLDEVRRAHARADAAARRFEAVEVEVLPRLGKSLDVSEAAYAAGQLDFLGVVDTQRQLLAAKLEREAALAEHAVRRAELERAAGGAERGSPAR